MSYKDSNNRVADEFDPSFGTQGMFSVPDPENSGNYLSLSTLIVGTPASGSSERIYVGGTDEVLNRYLICLSKDGELDLGFGKEGYCKLSEKDTENEPFFFNDLVLSADGSITIFCQVSKVEVHQWLFYPAAYRVTKEGVLDTSFGNEGNGYKVYLLDIPEGFEFTKGSSLLDGGPDADSQHVRKVGSRFRSAKPLADGVVFLATIFSFEKLNICSYVAKINTNGSLDQSFGNAGVALVTNNTGEPLELVDCASLAIDELDRIVVVGNIESIPGDKNSIGIVTRFDKTGSLDKSFGDEGYVRISNEGFRSLAIGVLAIESKLIILYVAIDERSPGERYAAVIKLTSDGVYDKGFNKGEPVIAELPPNGYSGQDVSIDQGRRIVVCGGEFHLKDGYYSVGVVSRIMPVGILDKSFGVEGKGHKIIANANNVLLVDIQGIQNIVVLTSVDERDTSRSVVARIVG